MRVGRMRSLAVGSLLILMLGGGSAFALNGDNHLDAVFSNDLGQRNRLCLGDGASGFTCSDVSTDGTYTRDVALGDMNGDGNLDAVFVNAVGTLHPNRVCLGDGAGDFTCSDVSMDVLEGWDLALGDVDRDGNLDVVFANLYTHRVCLGNGVGGFTCSDVSTDLGSWGVALGDVNRDGDLDAVFAGGDICLGNGAGDFTCSNVSTGADDSYGVALGDVNGDGNLDAVFADHGGYDGERNRVCLGNGAGGFTCSDISTDSENTLDVALGDVNGDGDLDAVFAERGVYSGGPRNRVCLGNGAGDFTCSDVSMDAHHSWDVALADMNGDGDLDAVFANRNVRNRVCLGDGAGGFTCSDVSTDALASSGVALVECADGSTPPCIPSTNASGGACCTLFDCTEVPVDECVGEYQGDGTTCDEADCAGPLFTTLCHIPPGNPNNAHTITVGLAAALAHLNHGDTLGPCGMRVAPETADPLENTSTGYVGPLEFQQESSTAQRHTTMPEGPRKGGFERKATSRRPRGRSE